MPTYFVLRDKIGGMDKELIGLSMSGAGPDVHLCQATDVLTLPNGLTVAFLSGIDRTGAVGRASVDRIPMTPQDVTAFEARLAATRAGVVDVLFTFEWPRSICEHSSLALPGFHSLGSKLLTGLLAAQAAKARYHFAIGENVFFEREPFPIAVAMMCSEKRTAGPMATLPSRFISLAAVGSEAKVSIGRMHLLRL